MLGYEISLSNPVFGDKHNVCINRDIMLPELIYKEGDKYIVRRTTDIRTYRRMENKITAIVVVVSYI